MSDTSEMLSEVTYLAWQLVMSEMVDVCAYGFGIQGCLRMIVKLGAVGYVADGLSFDVHLVCKGVSRKNRKGSKKHGRRKGKGNSPLEKSFNIVFAATEFF